MLTIYTSRGLPGSGKTTAARKFIENIAETIIRVNRDEIRLMLGFPFGTNEDAVTLVQYAVIDAALAAGLDVYVDDTNLAPVARSGLERAADRHGATLRWFDYTNVPYALCVKRDAARPAPVGEEVIGAMWEKYLGPNRETG